ncbi:MAG: hypothetical protein J0L73_14230 [Verrucomicrobia bacterium]|nr:hypothetical protein [Verrucomicrobiota bacterium]
MFYTPPSLFDPPTYPRKKPLYPADQPPQPQADEAAGHEELRQPEPPQRQSMPGQMKSYGKALLQRAQSTPQVQTQQQRNAAPQDPPPSHPDESEVMSPSNHPEKQDLPDPAESVIPANTIPLRRKDTPPDYLRRLTEVGQPQGTLSKFLQLRPGPFSAATPQSNATPAAAQAPAPTAERPLPPAAAPTPVKDTGIETRAAAQLENARKAGAVIEGSQLTPHPDGQGGLLHHTGFALASLREHSVAGTSIPYRDDHGRQHQIPVQDMRRNTDPSGITSYHFLVDGKPVRVPEGSTPLFQIDTDGKRYTQTPDGNRRELGYAPIATSQQSVSSREQAAGEQKLEASKLNDLGVIGNPVQHGLKKEDGSSGYDEYLPPDLAEQVRLRDANTHFLQQEYPDIPVEDLRQNYNAYRDDYVRRNYDLPDGVDDKTFHHLNGQKMEQRSRVDGAAGAGVSSAMTSGQKLQAMSEWQKLHPTAGKDEQAAWHKTYDQVTALLDPYRSLVHKALDGGEHEQDVLLDTLADLPESHRELVMRYAAAAAKKRGENHMLGVAGTVGASAQRTLTDMFTSVTRIPPSLKQQVGEGQTSFKSPITSVDQALQALSADLQDPRHNYYKRVQQAGELPLRPLSDEEKSIMAQALQRESKRNGLALTMRSILNEAEPLNDTVLGKMAAGLGSSLPLVLATTPQGMLAAGAGYANADFHEIMAAHPEMDEAAASKVALVSGAVKAGLDKLSLFGLGKLAPNVAKVLSGQATSQMVKKAALQAVGTNVFENIQEGLQDLTRPAVQSLAASLDQDVHGVDWDREMKQFWGSRLDVALGVLPLTLLGIGHNTLQNRQSVLEILNNDKTLKLAGLAENDRADILKAAQAGDDAKSQALLQEAWSRRDPAVAAEAIKETDDAQGAATQRLKEQSGSSSDQQPPIKSPSKLEEQRETANDNQQPQTLPAPAADLKEVGEVLDNIQRLKDKAKDGPLSLDEQRELDHHEKVLAHTRVKNLENEQQVIRSLPQPRELDPVKAQALEEARAVLQRPSPGDPPGAPSPADGEPPSSPSSGSGSGSSPPGSSGSTPASGNDSPSSIASSGNESLLGSAVSPSPNNAKKKKTNTTSRGVKRNNPKDWKDTMKLWDTVGYQDLLSPANRALIKNNLVPIVDDAWIDYHPEDAGLKGEKISIHHVQGLPLNIPLPYSRHKDGHRPGGFRHNPGNVGSQLPIYPAKQSPPPPSQPPKPPSH